MSTNWTIIEGDCVEVMRDMAAGSVQCVVTSPPYWGLRDYGTGEWDGGDETCEHKAGNFRGDEGERTWGGGPCHGGAKYYKDICGKCGARRIDRQLGLEPTLDEYIVKMVEVFREIWRVLRNNGTLWLNCGDSYGRSSASGPQGATSQRANRTFTSVGISACGTSKQLNGQPWRLAFALQADGWYLRSDIIWHKPNPMPESVTDRPTKSHEYIFLLTRQPTYFYDADAVKEPNTPGSLQRYAPGEKIPLHRKFGGSDRANKSFLEGQIFQASGRNLRTVWTIPTQAFSKAHFATFPEKLVVPCIKAGTSEKGCCPECGAPWKRVVEREGGTIGKSWHRHEDDLGKGAGQDAAERSAKMEDGTYRRRTIGWQPGCVHGTGEADFDGVEHCCPDPHDPVPCTVLDPFCGSGTVGIIARQLDRSFIGIELNPEYAEMARKRIENPYPEPKMIEVPGQLMFESMNTADEKG